jgi:hypothetical protein
MKLNIQYHNKFVDSYLKLKVSNLVKNYTYRLGKYINPSNDSSLFLFMYSSFKSNNLISGMFYILFFVRINLLKH